MYGPLDFVPVIVCLAKITFLHSLGSLRVVETGILLPKLFWPIVRENCSSDREKLLKFKAEGREFAKFLSCTKVFW